MEQITTLPSVPPRASDAHKGDFGRLAIIGGAAGSLSDSPRMLGAPALCARGAVRGGCGLVRLAIPAPILDSVLAMSPFATGYPLAVGADGDLIAHEAAPVLDRLLQDNDALVIGTGMGRGEGITKVVVRALAQEDIPIVVDADAINALAETPDFALDLRAPAVFTPHPGEARRLCDAMGISSNPMGTEEQRTDCCAQLAQRLGCVVVLKGAGTVVSDGHRVWMCKRGHPCMGVGGTGDVLAGVIGSLIAQHLGSGTLGLFECSMLAVQAHAIAGERWAAANNATGGMIATELGDQIPAAIERLRTDEG